MAHIKPMQTETVSSAPAPAPAAFQLTDSAAARINQLASGAINPESYFRILVKGGGCSGFQYEFSLDDTPPAPTDMVVERNGARAVVDDISLGLLAGSVLDYVEDLASAGFEVKNPNATASCGCGNSFSVNL